MRHRNFSTPRAKKPHILWEMRMAEGVGFEPTDELPHLLISSQVPLTTQPPFRSITNILRANNPFAFPTFVLAGRKLPDTSAFLKKIMVFFCRKPDLGTQMDTDRNQVPWPKIARIGRCQPLEHSRAHSHDYCTSMSL